MEKTSWEKLREEGCFFLVWLKILVKKNPFHSSFVKFFPLFSSPVPLEAGVVQVPNVKKQIFFCQDVCSKIHKKPQVCFSARVFVDRSLFQHRLHVGSWTEVESQTAERLISNEEGKCFSLVSL